MATPPCAPPCSRFSLASASSRSSLPSLAIASSPFASSAAWALSPTSPLNFSLLFVFFFHDRLCHRRVSIRVLSGTGAVANVTTNLLPLRLLLPGLSLPSPAAANSPSASSASPALSPTSPPNFFLRFVFFFRDRLYLCSLLPALHLRPQWHRCRRQRHQTPSSSSSSSSTTVPDFAPRRHVFTYILSGTGAVANITAQLLPPPRLLLPRRKLPLSPSPLLERMDR